MFNFRDEATVSGSFHFMYKPLRKSPKPRARRLSPALFGVLLALICAFLLSAASGAGVVRASARTPRTPAGQKAAASQITDLQSEAYSTIRRPTTRCTPPICMGRERRLANAPYLRPMNFLLRIVGWMRGALLETLAANAGRWFARAPRLLRPIATSGSARLAIVATGGTGRNCARGSWPLGAISRRLSSKLRAPCCGSTGKMAPEPSSPMWLGSRL